MLSLRLQWEGYLIFGPNWAGTDTLMYSRITCSGLRAQTAVCVRGDHHCMSWNVEGSKGPAEKRQPSANMHGVTSHISLDIAQA